VEMIFFCSPAHVRHECIPQLSFMLASAGGASGIMVQCVNKRWSKTDFSGTWGSYVREGQALEDQSMNQTIQ
jgi:hypothetical protein